VRATKAYIASFGTTGTLIAAALLTMSVMSAVVAFNGFPGQGIEGPIGSVQVQERQAPLAVETHPVSSKSAAARHASAASARHARRHSRGTHGAKAPIAHANPVSHGQSGAQQKTQQQKPSSSTSTPVSVPDTSSVTKTVSNAAPSTPSVPATPSLPSYPVTLPGADQKQLPISLPVDTSGVTNVLNTVLGQ
jgi:hypothetical protein